MSTNTLFATLPPNSATAAPTGGGVGVGLGYGIAIAVGILLLVSTIMLASYLCVRVKGGAGHHRLHSRSRPATTTPSSSTTDSITTNSTPVSVGLDEPTIESFTKFFYGAAGHARPVTGPCPICLADYREGETMRCVPECEHCFHAGCVDEWLRVSATCPLCRGSPVPSAAATPVATPLSELIPLAVHAR